MLIAIGLGMVAANSPLSGFYDFIHHYPLGLVLEAPLIDWINQGLLVIFFFHIGLHTKHEMITGVLAAPGRAVLPGIAALGGMIVPALIYSGFNAGDPEALRGWAIPVATDVVLVLGLLSFFGAAVSPGLLALITAIAIFDDLGAVIVIAVFYGEVQGGMPLAAMAAGLLGLIVLNRRQSGAAFLYFLSGALLWAGIVGSGLEGAVAGAIVGLALPFSAFPNHGAERVERRIAPLALFFVVPVFAFFNSGVTLGGVRAGWLADPVALGIVLALVAGKPLGVALGAFVALRTGLGSLPSATTLRDVVSAALFAGIGFTMSLFIVTAAFDDPALSDAAKLAVLAGSTVSAILAALVLLAGHRKHPG